MSRTVTINAIKLLAEPRVLFDIETGVPTQMTVGYTVGVLSADNTFTSMQEFNQAFVATVDLTKQGAATQAQALIQAVLTQEGLDPAQGDSVLDCNGTVLS